MNSDSHWIKAYPIICIYLIRSATYIKVCICLAASIHQTKWAKNEDMMVTGNMLRILICKLTTKY